jgi:threonine/homoserine/homoserine lactone efflux protein
VAGTAVGVGLLLLAMAAGVGALLTAVPGADLALKLAGSAYLLVLAWRIARSRGLLAGAAFQFANPKAWLFALAAVGTFQPRDLPPAAAALTVAGLCAVLALVLAASVAFIWAQERRAGSIERSVGKMAPTGD